ncbi:MAG: large subunit ribosomal protein [Gaiellales bacterium]|jgi:large subunit ribosomal protein L25|nr:large subunit ribosomal protein [Gaiellales bacterium]
MERVKLEVRSRDGRGRKSARALRAEGQIPGVIYTSKSGAEGSTSICVGVRDLRQAVSGPGGLHAIMDVMVDGGRKAHAAVIKDLQLDPVRDRVLHIDFHEVRLDQPINTVVAVHLEGTPHGVEMGGVLSQPVHDLNISVLPTQIPEGLSVDVSALEVGGSLRLIDVPAPEGVTFLDDPESTVLASVTAPISEEELEPEAVEGEELPEGVEAPEGEGAEGEGGEEPSQEPAGEE